MLKGETEMNLFGKKFALVLALIAVFAMAGSALAAEPPYIKIGENTYATSEEIADALDPGAGIVTDGAVIEVYGEVEIPFTPKSGDHEFSSSTYPEGAFFVISNDNVSVEGKTEDALLYPSKAVENGVWASQNFITVFGNNVTIKDIAIMPKFDANGNTNKTVEVCGEGFTMVGCTFEPNTFYTGGNGETTTADGGSLCISNGKNATITDTVFNKACVFTNDPDASDVVTISGCTFDTPAEDTYFIGNNTWANPPSTHMGTMNVTDCKFMNVPQDYNKVILHRMNGTFNLERNSVTLVDGTNASLKDMIAFDSIERHNQTIAPEAEKTTVKLTENGHVYNITPTKNDDGSITATTEDVTPDIAAPVATPKGGTYTEAQTVELTAGDGATIFYTTDGTDPTEASNVYTGAIKIEKTTTLKAMAMLNGAYGAVMTEVYTIESSKPETPQHSSGGGGCSAGFGALALLAAVPLMFRRKK